MKQFYLLILFANIFIDGFSQIRGTYSGRINSTSETTHCMTIRGNRTNGRFKQLLLDSKGSYQSDTSQPEIVAAAWTCASGGYNTCNFRGLFRYDVSSVPANAVITSAKLYLYAKTNAINGYYGTPMYGNANTALLQKVTSGWTVANTGWLNQPAATATNQKTLPQSTSAVQNYVVDVTDFVQSWVNQPATNYGMLLRLQNESYYNSMIFNSGQATDTALQPLLEICYQLPPTPPTCNNSLVITGDRSSGKFQQALMSTWHPTASDTAQNEIVAAAWTCSSGGFPTCSFRSMLRYNVSSIPANAVVSSARLYLYAKTNNINGNYGNPTFGSANTTLLQKATSPWNNATVAWNNQPAVTTTGQKILPQSTSTAQNYIVDVTDFVQSWVNKPDSNFGMMLRLQAEEYYNSMIFNSGQATDSTLRPRLEICYSLPGADSCKANFTDSIWSNNSFNRLFTAVPTHNNTKKPVQVCWIFGDGTDTCFSYNPGTTGNYSIDHNYRAAGAYTVCVKIAYEGGCVAEKCRTITVVAPPVPPVCNNMLVIRGNRADGKFQQALMSTWHPTASDTAQNEIVAAAWTCSSGGFPTCSFRSMLRYNVSSIPANAVVSSARLYLYAKTNNINGNYGNPTFGTANTTLLQKATSPWNNATVAWNNQPAVTTTGQKILPQSTNTAQNYIVDVTDFVQSWVNKPDSNFGMMLRLQAEEYYNSMIFNSGQATDSTLVPRLEICYTVPATGTDSCRGNFTDSIVENNPLKKLFIASTWHSANKKPVQICWNFGDGKDTCFNYISSSTNYNITHTYPKHGNYNVCVTIKYDGGCVTTRCRTITVFGTPSTTPACTNSKSLIVLGDRMSGKFKQLFLDSNAPFAADTSQPELGAAAWTCYSGGYPTCNFRSLFRYELSSLPTNTRITSAKLHLYAKSNNINGLYGSPTYGSSNNALLQQVTAPWTVGGTGWNNQPVTTTERQKQLPQSSSTAQDYVVDVTDFVQTWVKQPEQNHGMLLRLQAEQYYNSLIFNSGQAPDSLKPRLEICYQIEAADSNKVEVKLYPNPTTGPLLAWVYTSNAQKGSASLHDLSGNLKQVLKSSITYYAGVNVLTFYINRVSVPAGHYYVRIWVGGTLQTFKVLVL
ncbi:DNRLRE domain-containing protein [Longitalea luteola]|uniref:DNRLRE domain-containing protein n=1 Tax=Longitalea luteola TaxID=2812563 RepID=UPI001A96B908|nr:DNRLRE domain-containing protein [Longitalea luteola]